MKYDNNIRISSLRGRLSWQSRRPRNSGDIINMVAAQRASICRSPPGAAQPPPPHYTYTLPHLCRPTPSCSYGSRLTRNSFTSRRSSAPPATVSCRAPCLNTAHMPAITHLWATWQNRLPPPRLHSCSAPPAYYRHLSAFTHASPGYRTTLAHRATYHCRHTGHATNVLFLPRPLYYRLLVVRLRGARTTAYGRATGGTAHNTLRAVLMQTVLFCSFAYCA